MLQICRSKYEHIFNYTIYGERHSGTNFLQSCIKKQFDLDITYFFGFKHFFGWSRPEVIAYHRHTLFIGIVRDPYDWIGAMFNAPHHVPSHTSYSMQKFLTNEWYSVNLHNQEIMEDRNFALKPEWARYKDTFRASPRFKNIFELRKTKCHYLSQVMPVIASNYILLSYNSFLKNYKNYLNIIGNRFDLPKRGEPPELQHKNPYKFDLQYKEIIDSNLDWDIEESLGYFQK